jgi:hypothetical protein
MPSPSAVSSSRAVPSPIDEAYGHTLRLPLPEMFSRRYLAVPPVKPAARPVKRAPPKSKATPARKGRR